MPQDQAEWPRIMVLTHLIHLELSPAVFGSFLTSPLKILHCKMLPSSFLTTASGYFTQKCNCDVFQLTWTGEHHSAGDRRCWAKGRTVSASWFHIIPAPVPAPVPVLPSHTGELCPLAAVAQFSTCFPMMLNYKRIWTFQKNREREPFCKITSPTW